MHFRLAPVAVDARDRQRLAHTDVDAVTLDELPCRRATLAVQPHERRARAIQRRTGFDEFARRRADAMQARPRSIPGQHVCT
jgi:hypothetical protein